MRRVRGDIFFVLDDVFELNFEEAIEIFAAFGDLRVNRAMLGGVIVEELLHVRKILLEQSARSRRDDFLVLERRIVDEIVIERLDFSELLVENRHPFLTKRLEPMKRALGVVCDLVRHFASASGRQSSLRSSIAAVATRLTVNGDRCSAESASSQGYAEHLVCFVKSFCARATLNTICFAVAIYLRRL